MHLTGARPSAIDMQDAVRMVLEAYRTFSPKLADLAQQVLLIVHIDAPQDQANWAGVLL